MKNKVEKKITGIVAASCFVLFIASCASAETTKEVSLTKEEAVEIALKHADLEEEEISKLRTERDREDGFEIYEIKFETDDREYDYEIKLEDGTILKMKFEILDRILDKQDSNAEQISEEDAMEIALDMVKGAEEKDVRMNKERDDERDIYEGKIVYEQMKYEFEIDVVSGDILSWEQESVFD